MLAAIERTKDRLLDIGAASEAARAQILSAVMTYWSTHPGVAISIVEKLLNYSILSPVTVIQWALERHAGKSNGDALAHAHIYELAYNTVIKVTGRVRQVVVSYNAAVTAAAAASKEKSESEQADVDMDNGAEATPAPPPAVDEATKDTDVAAMRKLFRSIEDALVGWASGSKDELIEAADGEGDGSSGHDLHIKRWGERWLRVFRRRAAIEEAFLLEAEKVGKSGGETSEA